ncbi:histidine kinase [Clostridia bacterium]|nr:histidine kinase [Clostridia bacterium]
MAFKRSTLKIWQQLLLISCVIVLLPLAAISLLMYRNTVNAYAKVSISAGEMSIQQASHAIESMLTETVNAADLIASDTRIQEIFNKTLSEYTAAERLDDVYALRHQLSGYESNPLIQNIRLVFPVYQQWLSNNSFTCITLHDFDVMLQQYDIALSEKQGEIEPMWLAQTHINNTTSPFSYDSITYIRMIRDTRNYEQLFGYVVIAQEISDYNRILESSDFTGESLLTLCDAHGNIIAQGGSVSDPEPLWEDYRSGHGSTLTLTQEISPTDWRLVMLLPQQTYRQSVQQTAAFTFTIVLALLITALLLASGLYRNIVHRINRIVQTMSRVKNGEMTARLPAARNDEIGSIEQHFNLMLERLQELIEKNSQMADTERRMHIRLLQSQINPHFMYNTLNSILWTAMDYHADKVCVMIKAMSDFYRISLQPGREEASISDELLHVKRYVALQNMRGILHVDLNIQAEDELLDVLIPNMLLQPVVENAFVHGFAGLAYGMVSIQVTRDALSDRIRILIEDNGVGLSNGECAAIFQRDLPDQSYGLYSIAERLRLRYGSQAKISLTPQREKGGTVVIIIIP